MPPTNDDWSMKPIDKLKYEELFESLHPNDGLLPGNKVRSVLMDSKLPLDVLSKIWDLADQDRDGSLDKHEFIVVSIHSHTILNILYFLFVIFSSFFFYRQRKIGHAFSLSST